MNPCEYYEWGRVEEEAFVTSHRNLESLKRKEHQDNGQVGQGGGQQVHVRLPWPPGGRDGGQWGAILSGNVLWPLVNVCEILQSDIMTCVRVVDFFAFRIYLQIPIVSVDGQMRRDVSISLRFKYICDLISICDGFNWDKAESTCDLVSREGDDVYDTDYDCFARN